MPKSAQRRENQASSSNREWRRVRRLAWAVNAIGVLSWSGGHGEVEHRDEEIRTAFQEAIAGQGIELTPGLELIVEASLARARYSSEELLGHCEAIVDDARATFTATGIFSRAYPVTFPARVFQKVAIRRIAAGKAAVAENAVQDRTDRVEQGDDQPDRPAAGPIPAEVVGVSEGNQHSSGDGHRHPLVELFAGLPPEPRARIAAVVALQHAFREQAAIELRPAVEHLLKNPPAAFAEKQALASAINQAFHELGIAASEAGSSGPCSVVASRSSTLSETGYMRLKSRKGAREQSAPTNTLAGIEVVPAPREEAFSRNR